MADHDELVAEMLVLEQMGTQERQKLAKKRRMQQLKKWSHREKEWIAKEKQLNKRLTSILNEENNGLNLKQYTTYNSNQRTKKRISTKTTTTTATITIRNNNGTSNNNLDNEDKTTSNNIISSSLDKKSISSVINNNNLTSIDGPYANNLAPNGRIHFDVGVMLLEAAARNDYDELKRLLSLGVSPDSVNHDGLTALHQSCIDASELIMNLLLEHGANVDARDTERWTPLHAACTCGHLNLVKILVEHGADLLAVNSDGNMPFDICEDEATLDYIESQMIKQGITQEMIDLTRASSEIQMLASLEELAAGKTNLTGDMLNYADDNGVTQLHIAATNNYLPVVKFLLKHGVNVNVCDTDRWTPLHGVACWGNEQHIKIAEMLVEAGANLDAKTSEDETVFDLCDNVALLERLNQLKDELESKQANGPDRLRRTQSRTNSRVHSVRRTRVQDKNQISRRDAREEAMLRVESSENIGDATTNGGAQPSRSLVELKTESMDTPSIGSSSSAPYVQSRKDAPVVTDLDQQASTDKAQQSREGSLKGAFDVTDSTEATRSRASGQGRQSSSDIAPESVAHDSPLFSAENGASKVQPASPVGSREVPDRLAPMAKTTSQNCDSIERQQSTTSNGTTVIQVHLAPINYTLSNLKKHRSDLRLRGVSSVVQLDPAESASGTLGERSLSDTHSNGWPNNATITKFQGLPSGTIGDRRRGRKCCMII